MNLSEQLTAMQETLQTLSAELEQIRQQVTKLEEENDRLRQRITPVVLNEEQNTAGGHNALQQLYDEGYHICPPYFGKEHDGGCLFCMEVLKNVTK